MEYCPAEYERLAILLEAALRQCPSAEVTAALESKFAVQEALRGAVDQWRR